MSASAPRISIGLPVYNGQQYLDVAVGSILAQGYDDFELIIADNASTDDTLERAHRWADSDARIRVIESSTNLGAAPNFNRLVSPARGEFFKWMACDDLIESDFLERCVEQLDRSAETVLVYCDAVKIDSAGRTTRRIYDSDMQLATDAADPADRFGDLVTKDHSCISVFGLIRKRALERTDLIGSYFASDRVLLADLALLGPFFRIGDPLIRHREHEGRSTKSIPDAKERVAWFDTSIAPARLYPHWRLLREYHAILSRRDLSLEQRVRCRGHLARWVARRHWKKLLSDLR